MTQPNIGYLLTDIIRLLRKSFQEYPHLSCLTLAQAKALKCVAHHPGVRQVELAERLEIKPMTLVRVIDQLVEAGLVSRERDPQDRRAHCIYTTPAAGPILEKVMAVANTIWGKGLEGLTEQQVNDFIDTLTTIHRNLSQE